MFLSLIGRNSESKYTIPREPRPELLATIISNWGGEKVKSAGTPRTARRSDSLRYAAIRSLLECQPQQSEHSHAKQHQAGGLGDGLDRKCCRDTTPVNATKIIGQGVSALQESRSVLGTRIDLGSIREYSLKCIKQKESAPSSVRREDKTGWVLWNVVFRIGNVCDDKSKTGQKVGRQ